MSFKTDSGDIRFSPVIPFLKIMKDYGFRNITVYDPLITKQDKISLNLNFVNAIHEAIDGADCVAFMTAHNNIKALSPSEIQKHCSKGALIFDGRRYFSETEIKKLMSMGLCYKGIGR